MDETEKILEKVESASIENALNTNKQDTSEDKKDLMKLIEKIYVFNAFVQKKKKMIENWQ